MSSKPGTGQLKESWFKLIFKYIQLTLAALVGLAVLGCLATVQVALMIDIVKNPSVSQHFSIGVDGCVAVIDGLLFLSWYRRVGLFPFQSDEWRLVFQQMEKKQPKVYEGLLRLAQNRHRQKGLLRRLLTRPNPVREAIRVARKIERQKRSREPQL